MIFFPKLGGLVYIYNNINTNLIVIYFEKISFTQIKYFFRELQEKGTFWNQTNAIKMLSFKKYIVRIFIFIWLTHTQKTTKHRHSTQHFPIN